MPLNKTALLPMLMTIIFNSASQILIKRGVTGIKIDFSMEGLKSLTLNGWVVCGLLAQIIAVFFWFRVLSIVDLSVAFPILTSMLFIIILTASWFLLGERITIMQGAGILLIIFGIFCLAGRRWL